MESPCTLLTLLTTVFGASTSAAFRELAGVLFPFTALVVGTLANTTTSVILAAEVSHDNASPVLHISTVIAHCELLDKREEVEIVGKQILFVVGIFIVDLRNVLLLVHGGDVLVNGSKLFADLETRNKVALLEIRAKATVFGDIGKKLQRHKYIFLPRHSGNHLRVRDEIAVQEISGNGSSGQRRLWRCGHRRTVRRESNRGNWCRGVVVGEAAIQGTTMVDIEGAGFLVGLGDCWCSQIESCTTKHGVSVLHGDILNTNS
ncbi:hypothetical protein HG531_004420 [Fusarium graminearum]|nr:hypothetical protein HG531_004420 [Fusarium graminearum]